MFHNRTVMFSSLPKCSLLWLFIFPYRVLSQGCKTSLKFWHGQKFGDLISISCVHATEKLHCIVVAESITSIFRATEITHIHLDICHVHVDHDDIGIHTTFRCRWCWIIG